MTERKRKPKAGGPRTEVFAMRLDPKLKYLAEIAARKQRRSLANFVEWAIEQALPRVPLIEQGFNNGEETVADAASKLWALDESDRLILLAANYSELLTYDEQLIWRVICEYSVCNNEAERVSRFKENDIIFTEVLRDCWPAIKAYALGTGTKKELDSALCESDSFPF